MKIKELMEKANIKELKVGPVYLMLIEDTIPWENLELINDMFEPADVRILQVPDPSDVRIFELEPEDETHP